jgi:hypothetical protein
LKDFKDKLFKESKIENVILRFKENIKNGHLKVIKPKYSSSEGVP